MKKEYENYPLTIIFISNFLSILIYLSGMIIIYQLGIIYTILYLIFTFILEFKLIKYHCRDCYYYGKNCAFGKGKICSIFFKKGNSKNFCNKHMTWKDMLPDFMVSLIPFIIGIILLIINFKVFILLLVVLLFILTFFRNAFVRQNLACRYCKQRKLGCPAERFFNKK